MYAGPQPGIRNGGCKIIGRGIWRPLKAPSGSRAKPSQGGQGGKAPRKLQGFKHLILNILAFRIVGVKTNYSTKEIVFGLFFFKGGCTCTPGTPAGYGLDVHDMVCFCGNVVHVLYIGVLLSLFGVLFAIIMSCALSWSLSQSCTECT